MEFREYWNIARKRGWIVLLAALMAAVGAFGVSQIMPETYQATIQLSVEPARPDWGLNQATKDLLRNYVLNIKSHSMTQQAIDRAQLDMTTDQFLADLDVSADSANLSLTIQAESRDPEEARLMAQTLADVFVQERAQWNQEIDVRDRIYVDKVDDVRHVPLSSPNWKINTLAGAILGAIVGGVIVFFLEWLESDILRTSADVQKAVGLPVLGAIPTGAQVRSGDRGTWVMPAWIEPGLLLAFAVGGVLGAALGALIVALL
ncbi:MAG: Wzz/FepE/Etk N-terminal domain-containing protein [Anaerolineae bacterium]|jgi:capsular polysaccharide biosynthesis protein